MFRNSNILALLLASSILVVCAFEDPVKSRILSRRKRYVAFPEGSSFSCAGCMTVGVIGQPAPTSSPGTFTFGLNWGVAYELPNSTETARYLLHTIKR
ncbi:Uncharacterized protein OBRU01_11205 [Operophtera brumata]|uniref:Uncharacterized protein n=1 Tax=Operophtera brumata TaxID=104452 RepID=A0A0L7LCK6_OPEBR|nr:Uncharacterized protein OBRU01_11205 [Operophtera brumata]